MRRFSKRLVQTILKRTLCDEGIFRYDDMFSFTQHVLAKWPSASDLVSHRFPMVFIDEMQDTDSSADQVLKEIFNESVVVQRFGDVNQAILSSSAQGVSSFPMRPYLNVSGSMRFGAEFADVVSKLRLEGPAIAGHGEAALCPVTFLAYTDATVDKVIPRFGELVAEMADVAGVDVGIVKAICARQKPMDNPKVGCNLSQYWPTYIHQKSLPQPTKQTIGQLLASACNLPVQTTQLTSRVDAAKIALIRLLRLAGCSDLEQVRT